jgi:hypothetical protein
LDTPTAAGRQPSAKFLLRSVVLLAMACAGTAAAAPCAASNCDRAAQDLQAAGLPLTVRSVDLGDAGMGDDPAATSSVTESMAPLLFLGPRVTSILEDVFDADEMAAAAADETQAFAPDAPEPLRSPVAETDTTSAGRAPSAETDHASILPKYQRQMYRTDI